MSAPLLPLLLLGCWPYISGSWVDNAPARAAGVVSWTEFEGAGWQDNTPSGTAYWGWFEAPQDGFSTEWVLPAPIGCSDKTVNLGEWTDSLVDLDGTTSVLSSENVDLPLTWYPDSRIFYGALLEGDMDELATTWDLDETALVEGPLAVSPFVTVPGQIPYYGPDPGSESDAQVPGLGLDQLVVTWSGDAADVVAIAAQALDPQGNGLEQWTCAADGADGEVEIPTDRWDSSTSDDAEYLLVSVSHLVYTNTAIDGMEAESRGVGVRTAAAVYTLEK